MKNCVRCKLNCLYKGTNLLNFKLDFTIQTDFIYKFNRNIKIYKNYIFSIKIEIIIDIFKAKSLEKDHKIKNIFQN